MVFKQLALIGFWSFIASLPGLSQLAPNFTMTDTKGVEWSLYDQLGQDKVVILDFFFADCVPCQTLTPAVQSIYDDFGAGEDHLIVFGISDRDDDEKVLEFEDMHGVTYPSCGIEGGGDTITNFYSIGFPFIGWPTYAVVCRDTSIVWSLPRNEGLPELRAAADSCISKALGMAGNVSEVDKPVFPNPADQFIYVSSKSSNVIGIYALDGRLVKSIPIGQTIERQEIFVGDLSPGIYILADGQEGIDQYTNLVITR